MLNGAEQHYFFDISAIHYKDIDISFSVENLLGNDDYLMIPQRPQKQPKTKHKKFNGVKKQQDSQPKSSRKEAQKLRKRSVLGGLRPKECCEQKDTQDDSQTVKICNKPSSSKLASPRKITRIQFKPAEEQIKYGSNKIQPKAKQRSRTRSASILTPLCKKTQAAICSPCLTPVSIDKSLRTSNSQSQLSKARSQTIRANNQGFKAKNENIVRNDYFDEKQKNAEDICHQNRQDGRLTKKRSVSGSKRIDLLSKKLKKSANVQQKAVLRSPKALKK